MIDDITIVQIIELRDKIFDIFFLYQYNIIDDWRIKLISVIIEQDAYQHYDYQFSLLIRYTNQL